MHPVASYRVIAVWLAWLSGVLLILTGRASAEHSYLEQATDHATQAEVGQRFGQPTWKQTTNTGDTLWLYQREGGGTGARDFTPLCQQTWLTFDQDQVLRKWFMQRC